MKRREFFTAAGASAFLLASAGSSPGVAAPDASGEEYQIGDFILRRNGSHLAILQAAARDRLLWETPEDGEFLAAQRAEHTVKAFGTPEGAYEITDRVAASYEHPTSHDSSRARRLIQQFRLYEPYDLLM